MMRRRKGDAAMKIVFWVCLAVIALGLAYFTAIGLLHR